MFYSTNQQKSSLSIAISITYFLKYQLLNKKSHKINEISKGYNYYFYIFANRLFNKR